MGSIYMITNTENDKAYIGQTIHDANERVRKHFGGHGNRVLKNAIEKYGADAFVVEILHDGIIPELLNFYEIEAIKKYDTVRPNGYNLTTGGDSGKRTIETSRKISKSLTGKKLSESHRKSLSESHKGISPSNKGKKASKELRQKLSEAHKGIYPSEETRRKRSQAATGRRHTEETKRKLSEQRKGKPLSKEHRQKLSESHKGKPLSAEHRKKLSEAFRGRKLSKEHCRNTSLGKRLPEYNSAYFFFKSLPEMLPPAEKRKMLRNKFPNIKTPTIGKWVRQWQQPDFTL